VQTITLKVSDSVYDKFMWFLSHFSQDEVVVEDEELEYFLKYEEDELVDIVKNDKFIDDEEFAKEFEL